MISGKDEKIISDAELLDIPVFVLIAKDANAIGTLRRYKEICEGTGCKPEHIEGIQKRIDEFETWQNDHEDMVHLPD